MIFRGSTSGKHRWLVAAALTSFLTAAIPVTAGTPANTLVQGYAIDEIITMDPAEAFELSTAEIR